MKKGFTLIELLAVIVILAIIALIATPIVLSIINDTKESATLRSAEYYLDAVEQAVMKKSMNTGGNFNPNVCIVQEDGNLICDEKDDLEIDVKGEKPSSGSIKFNKGQIDKVNLNISNETIVKNDEGKLSYSACTLVDDADDSDSITPGDKYTCEVKKGTKYNFYVLSTNNKSGEIITSEGTDKEVSSVNLIMDQNINSDGSIPAKGIYKKDSTNGVYDLVDWISKEDYGCSEDDTNCYVQNTKGPITAMKFLYNATKDWTNIPKINYTYYGAEYECELYDACGIGGYQTFISKDGIASITFSSGDEIIIGTNDNPLRSRIADSWNDISQINCKIGSSCPGWLVGNLYLSQISNSIGYWLNGTSSFDLADVMATSAYSLDMLYPIKIEDEYGNISEGYTMDLYGYGVRPVITIEI